MRQMRPTRYALFLLNQEAYFEQFLIRTQVLKDIGETLESIKRQGSSNVLQIVPTMAAVVGLVGKLRNMWWLSKQFLTLYAC